MGLTVHSAAFRGPPDTAAPHSHSTKISECQDFCTTDLKEGNRRWSQHGCWASSLKLDLVWSESNSSVKANCFTGIQFVEPSIIPSFSLWLINETFQFILCLLILNGLLTFAFLAVSEFKILSCSQKNSEMQWSLRNVFIYTETYSTECRPSQKMKESTQLKWVGLET